MMKLLSHDFTLPLVGWLVCFRSGFDFISASWIVGRVVEQLI